MKSAQEVTWERDLSNQKAALADDKSALHRLDKQLRAAESSGKKVYLVITDALPEDLFADVKRFAKARGVTDVMTIVEDDIKATANTLKEHMKIGAKK